MKTLRKRFEFSFSSILFSNGAESILAYVDRFIDSKHGNK